MTEDELNVVNRRAGSRQNCVVDAVMVNSGAAASFSTQQKQQRWSGSLHFTFCTLLCALHFGSLPVRACIL